MNTSDIIILATIIVYMAVMVVIGIVLSRRNSNVGDFYLGGRKESLSEFKRRIGA